MDWKPNATYRSWKVRSVNFLDEYKSQTIHLLHNSGFEVFHVLNDNPENLFAFAFKTLPQDNTGIAHILEHTVLCGSEKYPLKDPFLNLIKSSLNTFLNAFTFPDKTVYAASSVVPADFFNLMRIYSDAVFHPLLKRAAFYQEGWHFKRKEDGELYVSGIVYNEMKGAYSSSESVMQEMAVHSLFNQSIYRFDSGGKPEDIPNLTYEDLVAFHQAFYHHSHTRLFLFGNIPTEDHLNFLEKEVLSNPVNFTFKTLPALPPEPRWNTPKFSTLQIPPSKDLQLPSVLINWITSDISAGLDVLGLDLLSQILLSDASPLVLRLLLEGYGEDISPLSGYESEIRDTLFSLGMRGVPKEKKDSFYDFVMKTLSEIMSEGLDPELVEGILFNFDFSMREIKSSGQGLYLMRRTLRGWIHDQDPQESLMFSKHLKFIKSQWKKDRYFEKLIKNYLLNNPHHTCLIFESDESYEKKNSSSFKKWLKAKSKELIPSRQKELDEMSEELATFQEEKDSPEALATIPLLRKEEIPKEIRKSLTFYPSDFGENILGVNVKTGGLVYVNLYFPLTYLPSDLFPILGLFHRAWSSIGTKNIPQEDLDKKIRLNFGHFHFSLHHEVNVNRKPLPWLSLTIATTPEKRKQVFNLTKEILFNVDWNNIKRLKELLLEIKNDFSSSLTTNGHQYAELLALSHLNAIFSLKESISGISAYQYWLEKINNLEETMAWLSRSFSNLQNQILNQTDLKAFVVTDNEEICKVWQKDLETLIQCFSTEKRSPQTYTPKQSSSDITAVILKTKVSFNAEAFEGISLMDKDYPVVVFISHLLRSHYLWQMVRMQGGAYGASSNAYAMGYFTFNSYRDPHTQKTLDSFRESLIKISESRLGEEEIYATLIGLLGNELAPVSPNAHAIISFKLKEKGISDEMRQKIRDNYFSLTEKEIVRVAKILLEKQKKAKAASLTSETLLKKEPFTKTVQKILL